jgi:hypothetical protein
MYALRIGLAMGMVFSRISTIFTEYSVWGFDVYRYRHRRGCRPMLFFGFDAYKASFMNLSFQGSHQADGWTELEE